MALTSRPNYGKSTSAVPNQRSTDSAEPRDGLLRRLWLPTDWQDLHLAVALSGGADSMSLLRALTLCKQRQGGAGKLLALHVNHQLRGDESTADAHWCQQQCDALSVPVEVLACNTAEFAAQTGDGIEAAAREQRYQLLTSAAEQAGVRYLAVAHTRDDQVETVLFRALRGTGLRGLAGIPRTRALTPTVTLIRPLLDCSRAQVIEFLAELGQDYRTDTSNTDPQFTRNRLRNDLLPQLRDQYNQELDAALIRLAKQAGDAQQVVEVQARRLLEEAKLSLGNSTLALRCQPFANQEPIVASEALRIAWRSAKLSEQSMTHQWWTRLTDLVQHPRQDEIFNLPGNVSACVEGDQLVLQW